MPKPKKKAQAAPVRASDFLQTGTDEEDSGDRWISSGDIPKGVRFYQRAYDYYQQAIALATPATDEQVVNDAMYNMARMQFVVYNKVTKPQLLDKIRPDLQQDTGLLQDLESIGRSHVEAIQKSGGEVACQIDLLYNYGQVLIEAGEVYDNPEWYSQAFMVFNKVLQRQSDQLSQFDLDSFAPVNDGDGDDDDDDDDDDNDGNNNNSNSNDVNSQPQVFNYGPQAVLETLTTFLQCATLYQEHTDCSSRAAQLIAQIGQLIPYCQKAGSGTENNTDNTVLEAQIAVAQYQCLGLADEAAIEQLWNQLPAVPARFMAHSDVLINLNTWTSLSQAAKLLQPAPTYPLVDRGKMWIGKGDVEVLRSKLPHPAAAKNRDTLRNNARVFYTNCVNLQSVGNMEMDRLKREAQCKIWVLQNNHPPSQEYQDVDLSVFDED